MLPQKSKLSFKIYNALSILFLFLINNPVFAQDNQKDDINVNVNLQDMVVNFVKSVPNLMRMVTAIAYVLGMYFIVAGIMQLKSYGESRTMMSQSHSIKGPILFLVIGGLLLFIPTSVQVGTSTFWGSPNPIQYLEQGRPWSEFINNIFMIVQFVGAIAFIRGLVLLSQLGGHGQPGTFAKGLTHIIGGIFCINIYQFVKVILITLGIQVQTL